MTWGGALFLTFTFATVFMNAIHWYTQAQLYPLLGWVPARDFVRFHQEYERRLPVALYLPYTLMLVANLGLLAVRPPAIAIGWVFVLLGLTVFIMAESVIFAAPVHRRLDRAGKDDAALRTLLRYNSWRLLAGTLSSLIVLRSLAALLA